MRTSLVTAPSAEPVTRDEAKLHCRIDAALTADDTTIDGLIQAAREACEVVTRSAFLTQTWDLFLDHWPHRRGFESFQDYQASIASPTWGNRDEIHLPFAPLQSVTSLSYYDASGTLQTLDPSAYIVSGTNQPSTPGRISPVPFTIWPITQVGRPDAIAVRFVCGRASTDLVPASTKLAIKILVAMYYQGREEPGKVPDGVVSMLGLSESGAYA